MRRGVTTRIMIFFKSYSFSSSSSSSSSDDSLLGLAKEGNAEEEKSEKETNEEPEDMNYDESLLGLAKPPEEKQNEATLNSIRSSVEAMKVVDLRTALKQRKLNSSGKKGILKDRLLKAILEDVNFP